MGNGHEHPPDSHGHSHHHRHQASANAGLENWRNSDLPFGKKLRLASGNIWIKVRRRQRCCGHPGEPGC